MEERHEILEKSIGCLAMEIEALEKGRIIRDWALIYLVVGSILELIFFKLYNGCFHPFANILKDQYGLDCKKYLLIDMIQISDQLIFQHFRLLFQRPTIYF